jgi:hypothetical protein
MHETSSASESFQVHFTGASTEAGAPHNFEYSLPHEGAVVAVERRVLEGSGIMAVCSAMVANFSTH